MNKEQLRKEILQKLIYPKKIPLSVVLNELSPAEFTLIASFKSYEKSNEGKHITVNELASNINISVPAVSKTLKKLEDRGLIQRITNKECRRNTFVVISEKGEDLYRYNKEKITLVLDKLMSSFSIEEIQAAISFYQKLENIINKEYTL